MVHAIDEPLVWTLPGPTVTVAGWCFVAGAPRAPAVRAALGSRVFVAGRTRRPDVAAAFPDQPDAAGAGFSVEIVPPDAGGELVLEAETACGWRAFFRRELRIDPAAARPGARRYAEWVLRYDTPSPAALRDLAAAVAELPVRPQLRLHWVGGPPDPAADAALERQVYREFGYDGDAEWIVPLGARDTLPPHALARLAAEIAAHPQARWIYSDEDRLTAEGQRADPAFKPDWDPDLLAALDYPCRLAAVRGELLPAGPLPATWAGWWALAREAARRLRPEEVRHIPHVLYHRAAGDEPLARTEAVPPARPGRWPKVSIVVPTRDRAELLRACVEAVLARTAYPDFEVVVVDHASTEPAARSVLAELARHRRVRVLPQPEGPFNFSALVNAGAAAAQGEVLALLNNDVEPLSDGWLAELVAHALRPEIGAVGARLDYPDGRIQHVGIALGVHGAAGMPFRGAPGGTRDAVGRTWATRRAGAVTAACLVVRREAFRAVGGFDAAELPVTFNDVDFCLRLGTQLGLASLVVPSVRLLHRESQSRGATETADGARRAAAELATLRARWAGRIRRGVHHSPNLTVDSEEATPAFPPRVPAAWTLASSATAEQAEREAQLAVRKRELTARYAGELAEFLAGEAVLDLAPAGGAEPVVSVLLVLHNRAELTLRCLRSLPAAAGPVPFEVVVVDNASTDATGALLARLRGATVLRNADNRHFVAGVNQAAAAARGRLLLLLNNDTEPAPAAIAAAVATLDADARIGAVGGKLVLPDGRLQEAGCIVWGDGRTTGVGRGDDPAALEHAWRRPVDYVSGAFLLTPRAVFAALGGLAEELAPAYYEEVDYCARVWQRGWRVVYEPGASVAHFEFASSQPGAAWELQERNRARFAARQALWLAGRPPLGAPGATVARRRCAGPARARALVLEDRIPEPSLGAGYPRTLALVRALAALDVRVTIGALRAVPPAAEAIYAHLPREVETVDLTEGLATFLAERAGAFDTLIVCRPLNFAAVADLRARTPALFAGLRLVYDAEAIFARRAIAQAALAGRPLPEREAEELIARELAPVATADAVLAVSAAEAAEFRARGARQVEVLAHAVTPRTDAPGPAGRAGLLFVGSFHADATPNADALGWFVREVLPRLPGEVGLRVAGRVGAPAVAALAGERVELLGAVADLRPLYDAARVFVAPGRYGAGIPLKIVEAAAAGVPVVTTPPLAAALGWGATGGWCGGASAEEFAAAVRTLLEDDAAWERQRTIALEQVARDYAEAAFRAAVERVLPPPAAQ